MLASRLAGYGVGLDPVQRDGLCMGSAVLRSAQTYNCAVMIDKQAVHSAEELLVAAAKYIQSKPHVH